MSNDTITPWDGDVIDSKWVRDYPYAAAALINDLKEAGGKLERENTRLKYELMVLRAFRGRVTAAVRKSFLEAGEQLPDGEHPEGDNVPHTIHWDGQPYRAEEGQP